MSRDVLSLMDFAKSLLELTFKKLHLSERTVIFIVIVICSAHTFSSFLTHQEKMEALKNEQAEAQWKHEEAMADDRLEERKLTIEEEKVRAEAELERLRIYLEHGGSLEDLPAEWKSKFFRCTHLEKTHKCFQI